MDGSAFAVYNLGLIDHRVGSLQHKLNDNLFHVLRVFRSGANVTLQVDDMPPSEKHPTGKLLGSVFEETFSLLTQTEKKIILWRDVWIKNEDQTKNT